MHFHVDIESYIPQQCMWSERNFGGVVLDAKRRKGETSSEEVEIKLAPSENVSDDAVDFDTPKSGTWSPYFHEKGNRNFLVMLHGILAAKAAVDLVALQQNMRHTRSATLTPDETQSLITQPQNDKKGVKVYVHGVEIIITTQARNTSLKNLRFSRMAGGVLVFSEETTADELIRTKKSEIMLYNAQSYQPSCCWLFAEHGIRRFVKGMGKHTVVLFILLSIYLNHCSNYMGSPLSSAIESPLVNSVAQRLGDVNVLHRIGETILVDMNKYYKALHRFKLTPEDVALTYSMAGSRCTPGTQGVPVEYYFEALLRHRREIGCLRTKPIDWDLLKYPETVWKAFEALSAVAYALRKRQPLSAFISSNPPDAWVRAVRRAVSRIPGAGPCDLMPDTSEIELQTRRAFWLWRYWRLAEDESCDKSSAQGLCTEWGYTENSTVSNGCVFPDV